MITTLTLFKLIDNIYMSLIFFIDTVETVHYFQITSIQLKNIKFNVFLIHFLKLFLCIYLHLLRNFLYKFSVPINWNTVNTEIFLTNCVIFQNVHNFER